MTLLQLRYFAETCHMGSTQKAADELNVSQSAVSLAIQQLEKELGFSLFDRPGRKMILNEAGADVLARAEKILEQVSTLIVETKKYSTENQLVRIGMPPMIAAMSWGELFPVLAHSFPETSFENIVETRDTLLKLIQGHSLEAVVMPSQDALVEFKNLKYTYLCPVYQRYVAMSIENPLASSSSLTYAQVVHEPLIGYRGSDTKSNLLRASYAKYGVQLKYAQTCSQLLTLISLLQKNMGIAYLDKKLVQKYPDLVAIPLAEKNPEWNTYLVWDPQYWTRSSKIRSVIEDYFKNSIKEE